MKTNFSILFFLSLLTFFYAKGQTKTNGVKFNDLYLTYKGSNIKFSYLKKSNTIQLLGKPVKIKKEKWETNNANVVQTFVYANGEIVFEDNVLSFIEIKKPGWALTVKVNNSFTKPLLIGSDSREIKTIFPVWPSQKDNMIRVAILTDKGEETDTSIIFTIKGKTITGIDFFSDES